MGEEFESHYIFDNRVYLSESKCFLFITDSGRIHLFPEGGIADKEIGGCGVTQRTLAQSERMLPGLISTIAQTIDTKGS